MLFHMILSTLEAYPERGSLISLQLFITCFFRQIFPLAMVHKVIFSTDFSSGAGSCILMLFHMVLSMLEAYPERGSLFDLQ